MSGLRDLMNALPDDRPVTNICVIENFSRCPTGHSVVQKTHDLDTDADLWKESFFSGRQTRYLCISKEEHNNNFIVDALALIGDKEVIPDGFSVVSQTVDTGQRAIRKRQICFRLVPKDGASMSITDIIVLSKSKNAPLGFTMVGDIESLTLCYKSASYNYSKVTNGQNSQLPYSLAPQSSLYPALRPAPLPPNSPYSFGGDNPETPQKTYPTNTIHILSALEGVPFELNQKYKAVKTGVTVPAGVKIKSEEEILKEFSYDFSVEYEALNRM